MPDIIIDRFAFDFPCGWTFLKYDDCTYYRKYFNEMASSKALDLLALAPRHSELWMVEIKDYRRNRRMKPLNMFAEIAQKVRDTLAGLAAARVADNDPQLRIFAAAAMQANRLRVAFLLEQLWQPSRLFPQVVDPASARTQLKKSVRAVDPHPFFGNASDLTANTAWNVTAP